MASIRGLVVLFIFQALGEAGNRLLGVPLPGPVLGMTLLFVVLCLRGSIPDSLSQSSSQLIAKMGLMLIPAATGFIYYLTELRDQILPVAVAASLGTVIAIIFTALLMNRLLGSERADSDE